MGMAGRDIDWWLSRVGVPPVSSRASSRVRGKQTMNEECEDWSWRRRNGLILPSRLRWSTSGQQILQSSSQHHCSRLSSLRDPVDERDPPERKREPRRRRNGATSSRGMGRRGEADNGLLRPRLDERPGGWKRWWLRREDDGLSDGSRDEIPSGNERLPRRMWGWKIMI